MTTESRRPAPVVARDEVIAVSLTLGPKPLAQVADELQLGKNLVYGGLWRLRTRGYVEKLRIGSRTPVWQLTTEGQAYSQEVQASQAQAPAAVPQPEPVV